MVAHARERGCFGRLGAGLRRCRGDLESRRPGDQPGLRSANELINSALAPYPDDLVIVTKVGPGRDRWGEWEPAVGPGQLRGQVEENLRQLGRDHLDVVNLRLLRA
jgi:hypothetical protein